MEIKSVIFLTSSADMEQLPKPSMAEYAFVGRSNVGKSSLINALCKRNELARTSSTPGKTQLINHFTVDEKWYLVDLPGYGYAKVSKKARAKFSGMISDYVTKRKNLMNVFVLVDSRVPPQDSDLEFMVFLGVNGVPFSIVFTKMDKLNQSQKTKNLRAYKKKLEESWEELPPLFYTSSKTGMGRTEILNYIGDTIDLFDPRMAMG